MGEVVTTRLKADNLRLFDKEVRDNNLYVFVSAVTTETNTRLSAVNSIQNKNLFLEKTLFGKKIFPGDVRYMIKYHAWQKDQVYVQYDDTIDLEDKKFYAVVGPNNNDTGDYRVYKCLFNNFESPSLNPPNYNSQTENQIYRTADKYVWKFMFVISESDFEAYNASGYVPLIGITDSDPLANTQVEVSGSSVSDIFVTNPIENAGYPFVSGIFASSPPNNSEVRVRSANLSQTAGYYVGMSIYCTDPGGVSRLYKISDYQYISQSSDGQAVGRVTISDGDFLSAVGGGNFAPNSSFSIQPQVEIKGDGTGAAAKANVVGGNISSVTILDFGSGYHQLAAEIKDPLFEFDPGAAGSTDVRCLLRPVLSPIGGHGFDLIDEMHCKHILLYAYVTETDNNQIGATNTFSYIGIVKNPEFRNANNDVLAANSTPEIFDNRIAITTDGYNLVNQNDIITQTNLNNDIVFTAKVHEVNEASNTIFLSEYMGPYVNSVNNDISLDYTKKFVIPTGQKIAINTPEANNVIESSYTQRSGLVYFMEDFIAFERTAASREEYKLVLEF